VRGKPALTRSFLPRVPLNAFTSQHGDGTTGILQMGCKQKSWGSQRLAVSGHGF